MSPRAMSASSTGVCAVTPQALAGYGAMTSSRPRSAAACDARLEHVIEGILDTGQERHRGLPSSWAAASPGASAAASTAADAMATNLRFTFDPPLADLNERDVSPLPCPPVPAGHPVARQAHWLVARL